MIDWAGIVAERIEEYEKIDDDVKRDIREKWAKIIRDGFRDL